MSIETIVKSRNFYNDNSNSFYVSNSYLSRAIATLDHPIEECFATSIKIKRILETYNLLLILLFNYNLSYRWTTNYRFRMVNSFVQNLYSCE